MHKSNNKKSKSLLAVILTSLIAVSALSASVMTGCGDDSATPDEAEVVGTSIVTNTIEETYYVDENGNVIKPDDKENSDGGSSKNESSKSEKSESDDKNSSDKDSSDKSESNNDNKNDDNKSESSNKTDSSSKPNSSSNKPSNNSSKTLSIDGNKFSVGDTVTCVYKLKTPEKLENFQAIVKYDSKYLKVKNAVMSGPADSGSVLNYNLDEQIKFNGTNISFGYNYTKEKEFVTVTYEVVSGGSTTPSMQWEVATGVSQKSYVKDGKTANGMELKAYYSN